MFDCQFICYLENRKGLASADVLRFHIIFTDGIRARFVDNAHNFSGRVQVYKDGTWGEICSADLSDNEAKVLCSMMGFK